MRFLLLTFSLSLVLYSGCGLVDYERDDNRPTTTDNSGTQPSASSDCRLQSIAFNSEIAPIIANQCLSCHSPGGIGSFPFIADDDASNLQIFTGLLNGDGEAIIAKASGEASHGGGNQLQEGDAARIRTYFEAVAYCNSQN